jgi:mRNA interferase YafQ
MRAIEETTAFRRDRKKLLKHDADLAALLNGVVALLATGAPLPRANADHPLKGDWRGYRDCHVRPDVLLLYRLRDDETLELARLGSHAELFG